MNRKQFFALAGTSITVAGVSYYLHSDRSDFTRRDIPQNHTPNNTVTADERSILRLASLAPSGHNTQPWLVKYLEPYHWIIGNDKNRWLAAVDPAQRETMLSIGAFLQNLEYAANHLGYNCSIVTLAATNQDEDVAEIKLNKAGGIARYDINQIIHRRTIRSNYLSDVLRKEDRAYLLDEETDFIHYIPNNSKEHLWLNEQTIEANRIQSYRNAAQAELANWIRFSSKDAALYQDGLTPATMEIEGISGWYLRNFYSKEDVMKKSFRNQSIEKVVTQVSESAGWLLITSKDHSVETLLQTGRRMQRLFLKVRSKGIAIHPMTQIIEEGSFNHLINDALGIKEPIQFILRTGYVKSYPEPVSLRRLLESFLREPGI